MVDIDKLRSELDNNIDYNDIKNRILEIYPGLVVHVGHHIPDLSDAVYIARNTKNAPADFFGGFLKQIELALNINFTLEQQVDTVNYFMLLLFTFALMNKLVVQDKILYKGSPLVTHTGFWIEFNGASSISIITELCYKENYCFNFKLNTIVRQSGLSIDRDDSLNVVFCSKNYRASQQQETHFYEIDKDYITKSIDNFLSGWPLGTFKV